MIARSVGKVQGWVEGSACRASGYPRWTGQSCNFPIVPSIATPCCEAASPTRFLSDALSAMKSCTDGNGHGVHRSQS